MRQRVDEWRRQGVAVYDPRGNQSFAECLRLAGLQPDVEAPSAERLYYCHRQTEQEDIYFLNNHSDQTVSDCFRFRTLATAAELWNPVTGERTPLPMTTENGRTAIDLPAIAAEVETRLGGIRDPISVAVMGCVVNGPGEAREADVGIAGGKGEGLVFRKGEILRKVSEAELVGELFREIDALLAERAAGA